jgi:hypothetical protein
VQEATLNMTFHRRSVTIIPFLDPPTRQVVVESYAAGLKAVFIFQAAVSFLALLTSLPIEENPLPSSHEERAESDAQRRVRQTSSDTASGE